MQWMPVIKGTTSSVLVLDRWLISTWAWWSITLSCSISNLTAAVEANLAIGFDGTGIYTEGAVVEEIFMDVEREDIWVCRAA